MSEHAFSGVICRNNARYVHRPSNRDVNRMSPVQGKSPHVQVKEPYGNLDLLWLLVDFHPATQSVQSTPADNTLKRVWQYIEKERKCDFAGFFKKKKP